jgi:transposase
MYLKVTKNTAGQSYYHLVESYWSEGKSRQRTLLSLGRVGVDGEQKLDELSNAISKHRETLTITQLAKEISVNETFILGPLLILEKLFDLIGINDVISQMSARHPQNGIDLKKTLFTMVACRFVKPGSKLKIFEHWRKLLYPEMIDAELPLHHLYRTLDVLAQHKDDIEESLYWRGRDLLSEPTDIVLYDLTTLRFESTKLTQELRRFGYSKEMRTDCTQVVFGLLLNTEGIPLGFEVYPGNTFEGKTLSGIVEKMRHKFRVRRMIFVADRGLFSAKNLEILKQDGGEFIVGHKLGTMKKLEQEELYDLKKFQWIVADDLAVLETKTKVGDRLIVTWSRVRAGRDAKTRADIISKLERKISSKKKLTPKAFVSNKNYQKFLTGLDAGDTPALNLAAIEADAKKDGFFAIVTNVTDLGPTELVMNYKELWKIEDAFGEIKGTLKSRPIFHWTDQRIIGHLVACFVAYLCEAHITRLLREKNLVLKSVAIDHGPIKQRPLTVAESLKELNEVRAVPVKIREKTIWCRTDIAGNAAALFKAVGVGIPPKILKTTSDPAGTN